MKKLLKFLFITSDDPNIGLLVLRVFVGAAMLTHGIPKITSGPEFWEKVGAVMGSIGVPGPAVAWGFMAAVAESVGAALLLLGALTTIASFLLVFTMSIAAFVAHAADPFDVKEKALLFLFAALLFLLKGAGRWSVDRLIRRSA
ncbi:MAG TPA: DoxX family protein [Kiritimatiellia bacterium]|nr:DoxX family protein [Kiritimatiellia bacterium]HRZ12395.1 DoxX family protein [Kiritimatiellia bacterium]HSA17847.1 DoxX family protein [Kiritimatiellia bacterium]